MVAFEYRHTSNDDIARMLDGLDTLPCVFCEQSCSVPGEILAVVVAGERTAPLALCPRCIETLFIVLPPFMEHARKVKEEMRDAS